jgi:phage tail-like protein
MAQKFEFRLHIQGPESTQDVTLPLGQATLGRDPGCEILIPFPLVSRRHAQFTCTETECEIIDLGSANGTSVNGVKLTPQVPASLTDRSLITIGPFEIAVAAVPVKAIAEPSRLAEVEVPVVENKPQEEKEAPPAVPVKSKKAAKPVSEKGEQPGTPVKPPPPPSKGEPISLPSSEPSGLTMPPGLSTQSSQLIHYLPGIYHTDFMSRFLALFESILVPIEWNVEYFDLYLDPGTAPAGFLPWLANWYTVVFDSTWSEVQRRILLKEAHQIYARRGTRWALSRVLEIYLGSKPEIIEFTEEKEPFTFTVKLAQKKGEVNQELVESIIDSSKPAHTSYRLEFQSL